MKKKLNKIAALVLALVMVITGFVAVPQMDVQAANDVPSIITKTDVTNMIRFMLNVGLSQMET